MSPADAKERALTALREFVLVAATVIVDPRVEGNPSEPEPLSPFVRAWWQLLDAHDALPLPAPPAEPKLPWVPRPPEGA